MGKFNLFLLFVLMAFVSACSSQFKINVATASYLNPDNHNQSLPVELKIYQLTNADAFQQASFDDLWLHTQLVLRHALLTTNTFMISPNTQKEILLSRTKKTKYLGVIAIFRNPNGSQWRQLIKVSGNPFDRIMRLNLKMNGNTLQLFLKRM